VPLRANNQALVTISEGPTDRFGVTDDDMIGLPETTRGMYAYLESKLQNTIEKRTFKQD
jgi:hypothetical protein